MDLCRTHAAWSVFSFCSCAFTSLISILHCFFLQMQWAPSPVNQANLSSCQISTPSSLLSLWPQTPAPHLRWEQHPAWIPVQTYKLLPFHPRRLVRNHPNCDRRRMPAWCLCLIHFRRLGSTTLTSCMKITERKWRNWLPCGQRKDTAVRMFRMKTW